MNFRMFGLPVAVAFVAVASLSLPARAAMPVSGVTIVAPESPIIQVAQKKKRMTRREEADQSARDGTVPARYRRDVPKQYHQYIPFAKQ